MIMLTKLNGIEFAVNDELIETISERPDTTICMTNKNIYIVQESTQEIIEKIIAFRQKIYQSAVSAEHFQTVGKD